MFGNYISISFGKYIFHIFYINIRVYISYGKQKRTVQQMNTIIQFSSSLKYPFWNIKQKICEKEVIWLEISTLNVITTIVIVVSIYRLNRPNFKDCQRSK